MPKLHDDRGYYDNTRHENICRERPTNLKPFLDHLEDVGKSFNRSLAKTGIAYNTKKIIEVGKSCPEVFTGRKYISQYLRGDSDGRIWDTQIRTFADILENCIQHPGRSGIVIGATMCGKTGTANTCYMLGPLLTLLTGKQHVVVTLLPNKNSIEQQMRAEHNAFKEFYCSPEWSYGGHKINTDQYYERLQKLPRIEKFYDLLDDTKSPIVRRSRGRNERQIENISIAARDNGLTVIYVIDEVEWGSTYNKPTGKSVQWDMLKVSENLTQMGLGDFMIGLSATPWPLIALENIWKVRHKLSPHYCGYNFFNGEVIDPDVNIIMPEHVDFEGFGEMAGIPYFTNVHAGAYGSDETFYKMQDCQQNQLKKNKPLKYNRLFPDTYKEYTKQVEGCVADAINWSLIDENPKNGRGVIMRMHNNKDESTALAQKLKSMLDPSIKTIVYQDEKVLHAAEKWIAELNPADPYLIIVSGAARMGDRFPVDMKYAFEFSERSTHRAQSQGLGGRLTGNNKAEPPPLFVLSAPAKEQLDRYIETQGMPEKIPAPGTKLVGGNRAKKEKSISLNRLKETNPAFLSKMFDEIEKVIHQKMTIRGNYPNEKPIGNFMPIWQLIKKYKSQIEAHFSPQYLKPIHILPPGEKTDDEDNLGYNVCKSEVKVGLRRIDKKSKSNSNLPTRFVPGGLKRDGNDTDRMEIQALLVIPKDKRNRKAKEKWFLNELKLRLKKETRTNPGNVLPDNTSIFSNFRTEAEDEVIAAYELAKS